MQHKIYIIQNTVNDMVYIGSTTQDLKSRWACHRSYAKHRYGYSKLYDAMRLIGIEKFDIDVIDYANTEREMLLKEKSYIDEFNSIKNGYNNNYPSVPDEPIKETNIQTFGLGAIVVVGSLGMTVLGLMIMSESL